MADKREDDYINTVLMILASFCTPLLLVVLYGGNMSELCGQSEAERNEFCWVLAGAALLGVLTHGILRHYFTACAVSAGSYVLLVMALSFLRGGFFGKFAGVGLIVEGLIGFSVAAPVGLVFHMFRKRHFS